MHLLRFDAADIENFVDQLKEMTAGREDMMKVRSLRWNWILPLQQLAEPKNGVERRAQFMAHAREKFALRAVRPVGRFFRFPQCFFNPLAFGRVVRDTKQNFIRLRPTRRPKDIDS